MGRTVRCPRSTLTTLRRARRLEPTRRATARGSRCSCGAPGRGATADPCPVVVDFHGGPEGQAHAGFIARAQLFVDAGFIFVEPNVRGSDGYGKAWLHADDGPKRLDVITDIEDAAKFIRANWAAGRQGAEDRRRRAAATAATRRWSAMTMFAGAYDAGVVDRGHQQPRHLPAEHRAVPPRRCGSPSTAIRTRTREALRRALADRPTSTACKAPLLLIQGVNDPRVPVGEAIQLHEALRGAGRALGR